jgi:hypothetical protein
MRAIHWVGIGAVLALVGAVLSFALTDDSPSALGVSLEALGGVLLATGALLTAAGGIASIGESKGGTIDPSNLRTITGLVAVVVGIAAVAALTIVTVARLGSEDTDSMVAVTSSAFGIVSAVISAYLGIKISGEAGVRVGEEAKQAAVAQHEAAVKEKKISRVDEAIDNLVSNQEIGREQADAIRKASIDAEEEARTSGLPGNGEAC